MKRLPRSLDEIGGLRAARWIRESTAGQYDRYGPASQREQQDRFIERHGLVNTGLVYQVAHSGRTVWRSATMATMVEDLRSGRFDLLLTGYADRWQRNLRRTLELLEDELHPNSVALVMCDRKILSSDPSDWDELISEATGAEKYSRRLSERITEGYAAKFDQEGDPGGHAGLGFRRLPQPPHTLEIDPDRMPIAVGLFERYALGNVSATQLEAETGLAATRIRMILMNPLYNGWIRRHPGPSETRRPAPWRFDPPVSDDLWARVEDVRRARTQGGGPRHRGRLDLLAGLLECTCGRRIRSDGRMGNSERVAKLHTEPCAAWGSKARIPASTWEIPVIAQLGSIRVDTAMRAQITAVLSASERPVTMDRARLERQMRELALEHAAARLDDAEYLARMARLRGELEIVGSQPARDLPARRATEWLDALAETWQKTELVEEKSDVIHAVYERIVIEGPRFVGLRLTPAAYRHGLALALPEAVMARPTGFERAAKLALVLDHSLKNPETFPSGSELKGFGHNLKRLLDQLDSVARSRGFQPPGDRLPREAIHASVVACLSEFANNVTRYYNLELIVGAQQATWLEDPIATWHRRVTLPAAAAHVSPRRRDRYINQAEVMGQFVGDDAMVRFTAETGESIETVQAAVLQSAAVEPALPWVRMYVMQLARFVAAVLEQLGDIALRAGVTDVPYFGDFFGVFHNEDAYFRSRKTWSIHPG